MVFDRDEQKVNTLVITEEIAIAILVAFSVADYENMLHDAAHNVKSQLFIMYPKLKDQFGG